MAALSAWGSSLQLPTWLATDAGQVRLQLRMRIADKLECSEEASAAMRLGAWASRLGFEVQMHMAHTNSVQHGSSCGLVAGDGVHRLRCADEARPGRWWVEDLDLSTSLGVIRAANAAHAEWAEAAHTNRGQPAAQRWLGALERDATATRYLESAEVTGYLRWRERQQQAQAPQQGQQQQQQQQEPPSSDPVLDPMRRLTMGAFDMGVGVIARELHGVVHGGRHTPGPHYLILSTADTVTGQACGGRHWILVAYQFVPP